MTESKLFTHYSDDNIRVLNEELNKVNQKHQKLVIEYTSIASTLLKNETARNYFYQGCLRRQNTLITCLNNIFKYYPPKENKIHQKKHPKKGVFGGGTQIDAE